MALGTLTIEATTMTSIKKNRAGLWPALLLA
jgi:hypothetical protein